MTGLQLAFWLACAIIVYTYAGCPLLIHLASRLVKRTSEPSETYPSINLLVPAHNEEDVIRRKLWTTH
jgi:cellulose synthase/poly-beta-1,6-N-acetylglucosamine synthase-like glycosyltransferase